MNLEEVLEKYKGGCKIRLTPEEESILITASKSGNQQALELIIKSIKSYVQKQACKKSNYDNSIYSDLCNEGMLGVLKAIDSYDVESEVKFITFAHKPISQHMGQFILKNNLKGFHLNGFHEFYRLNYLPKEIKDKYNINSIRELDEHLIESISKDLNIKVMTIKDFLSISTVVSIDSLDTDLLRVSNDSKDKNIINTQLKGILKLIQKELKPDEVDILKRRWLTDTPESLRIIGESDNITHQGVASREKTAFKKIFEYFKVNNINYKDFLTN